MRMHSSSKRTPLDSTAVSAADAAVMGDVGVSISIGTTGEDEIMT